MLVVVAAPVRLDASGAKQAFSVTLEVPDKPLKAGAELVLRAVVKNTSRHNLSLATSPGLIPEDGFRYNIVVHNARGRPAPPSRWVLTLRSKKAGPLFSTWSSNIGRTLRPGQSLTEEINVTRDYNLSQPGIYTIWLVRPLPLQVPPRAAPKFWKGSVRSNKIRVTVVK